MLAELVRHRDLLWLLTVREIRIRYARAVLGAAWALFLPLVQMGTFALLDFGRFIPEGSPLGPARVPYAVFAFCGLLPWTHFASSLTLATPSLVASANILRKSAFPREVVPLSKVLAGLLDLGIGAAMLAVLLVAVRARGYDIRLGPAILAVPAVFVLQFAFTCGLAFLCSAGNMFFRDVNYLVTTGLVLAMFATSVVYPVSVREPAWAAAILSWNPMSSYVDAYRAALLLGEWPGPALLPGVVGAVVSLGAGAWVFARLSPRFVEEV